jgi:hypothetical protein
MSETNPHPHHPAARAGRFPAIPHLTWQHAPYLIALVLAIAGVAYSNVSHQPLAGYWEFLALAMAAVCIVTKWPEADDRQVRFRLIWTQALHWAAVLVAMNIMLVPRVQQLLTAPATGLILLTLLALGTFLAGVSLMSLRIGFLGVGMIAAVPAISWMQQTFVFFLLAAIFAIGLGMLWLRRDQRSPPHAAAE